VAAVLPIHYPRALLRAFGVLPVEVWGPPHVDVSRGSAHLQPYVCSVVRNALSFLLSGGLDDAADLILVPHACDSLQGLGSILLDFVHPRQPVIPIYLPRGNRTSDVEFLADEFRALYRTLERVLDSSPSHEDVMECVRREEAADEQLGDLHRQRTNVALSQLDYYRLIRAREYLPAETFINVARATLARSAGGMERGGQPIVLSGIVPEPMELFDSIAGAGGVVVADDLASCGRRLYPPGRSDDVFQRMAESIVHGPPDPTRGSPIRDRCEYLLGLVGTSGAKGILFYDVKFCEPELFDLPILRTELRAAGIPSVVIEVDINDSLSQQVLTRLEAFLEMLR
jgi:benzoyl-CoA reductase/2-hydroxyglutaryl-CoA dehydratase subunit BcrC/BadD/HgdB